MSASVQEQVRERLQEAVRGGTRKAIMRLPDGTFAPRGMGRALVPGDKVSVSDASGRGATRGEAAGMHDAVRDAVQEALRGSSRRVPIKRLADGTFAPKGMGAVLKPGDSVELPDGSHGKVIKATGMGAPASGLKVRDASGVQHAVSTHASDVHLGAAGLDLVHASPKLAGDDRAIKRWAETAAGGLSPVEREALQRASKGDGYNGAPLSIRDAMERLRKLGLIDLKASSAGGGKQPSLSAKGKHVHAAAVKPVQEAADSMRKASTPEPFSRSKTSNWVARGGGLPAYIQHIAHDLVEKRGKSESNAIQMAIGIVKNWASGKGNVDANTRAAAAKAVAEWEALKAKAKARRAVSEAAELALLEAEAPIEREDFAVAAAVVLEADGDKDGDSGKDSDGDGDMPKVRCPECNRLIKPTKGGKCPNDGHDVSKIAKMVTRLRSKSK